MDNPKKKKEDSKKVSKQEWETDYMKKITKEMINSLPKYSVDWKVYVFVNPKQLKRILKDYLKRLNEVKK